VLAHVVQPDASAGMEHTRLEVRQIVGVPEEDMPERARDRIASRVVGTLRREEQSRSPVVVGTFEQERIVSDACYEALGQERLLDLRHRRLVRKRSWQSRSNPGCIPTAGERSP